MKPYKQLKIGTYIFRIFYKKEDKNLYYKWHQDTNTRNVWFLPIGKWYIQYNEKLPELISPFFTYYIPRNLYHRLIRKKGLLFCIISEK